MEEEDFALDVVGRRVFVLSLLFGLFIFECGGAGEEVVEEEGEEEGKEGMEVLPVVEGGGMPVGWMYMSVCILVGW